MNEKIKKILDKLEARSERATLDWIKDEEKNVEINVKQILNDKRNDIISKALGFEYFFGQWCIDHCNGRKGAAWEWLTGRAGEAARSWLDEQAGDLPKLPAKAINALKKEYLNALELELSDLLRDKAQQDAEKILKEIYPDYDVENDNL